MFIRLAYTTSQGTSFTTTNSMDLFKKRNPQVQNYIVVSDELFAALDKRYLHCYDIVDKKLVPNIEKAKLAKKEQLRKEREDQFKSLDIQFMLALESGDEAKRNEVVSKKEFLRNITNLVDNVNTFDELDTIKVKNLEDVVCTIDDLRAAGFCADGSKKWFESMGWDFRDFVRNGKSSSDFFAVSKKEDPMALAVIEAAYQRSIK